MNTNKVKIIIIVLAAAVMAAGAVCLSQKYGRKQHFGDKTGRIFKELNLNQEQQKRLEENRDVQRQKTVQLREAMKAKQAQLQEALKEPAANRASVEPLVNEIKSLQAQSIELRVDAILAVKKILTPQQFAKFQQIMDKYKEGRKWRFQD